MALHEPKMQGEDPQDHDERRQHPRDSARYAGRLAFGANDCPCTILDISAGGAQLQMAQRLQAWTIVTLHIEPFGSFHARVVWQRGDRVGLQFLEDSILVTRRFISAGQS